MTVSAHAWTHVGNLIAQWGEVAVCTTLAVALLVWLVVAVCRRVSTPAPWVPPRRARVNARDARGRWSREDVDV